MNKSIKKLLTSAAFKDIARHSLLILVAIVTLIAIGEISGYYRSKVYRTSSEYANQDSPTQSISYSGEDDKTVYELLEAKHKVESQKTELGVFVTSIDGVANSDSSFWIYYINDQPGSMTSDAYKTKAGDKVEWRYETFQ